MKLMEYARNVQTNTGKEDFNWISAIGVMLLILAFIGATFYVLVSSIKDLTS